MASPVIQRISTPTLAAGDPAYDFTLPELDLSSGVARRSGRTFHLAEHAGLRPVALIFGSYTSPPFRRQLPAIEALYQRYREEVAFVVVYIREAHPEDGWVVIDNREENIRVFDPTTDAERRRVVEESASGLAVRIPVVIDEIEDGVAGAYGGWPDRLYLVGHDGRIAFQGGMGPFGFVPTELEAAIEEEVHGRSDEPRVKSP